MFKSLYYWQLAQAEPNMQLKAQIMRQYYAARQRDQLKAKLAQEQIAQAADAAIIREPVSVEETAEENNTELAYPKRDKPARKTPARKTPTRRRGANVDN